MLPRGEEMETFINVVCVVCIHPGLNWISYLWWSTNWCMCVMNIPFSLGYLRASNYLTACVSWPVRLLFSVLLAVVFPDIKWNYPSIFSKQYTASSVVSCLHLLFEANIKWYFSVTKLTGQFEYKYEVLLPFKENICCWCKCLVLEYNTNPTFSNEVSLSLVDASSYFFLKFFLNLFYVCHVIDFDVTYFIL